MGFAILLSVESWCFWIAYVRSMGIEQDDSIKNDQITIKKP